MKQDGLMMDYVTCYSKSIIKGSILVVAGIFFSFQNCSDEKQPVRKKLKRGYGCVVCMLLITAAGREEVSEVQDVVAWRCGDGSSLPRCGVGASIAELGSDVRG